MKTKQVLIFAIVIILTSLAVPGSVSAFAGPVTQSSTFRIALTSRTTPAVKYNHRSGSTKVDFAGTDLMPNARGVARVDSKPGALTVDAEFSDLDGPMKFGAEYLTYVLWAVSPEGRPVNLGEVLVGGNHKSKLRVTTDLQVFALIVTAEPYYAVRQPSNVVVLENAIRNDTVGTIESVNAKYELMQRGGYIPSGYRFDPVVINSRLPLEYFEARNALRIAKSEGADQFAAESYSHAKQQMEEADSYATRKDIQTKELIAAARAAVQTAEDARAIAVRRSDEEARSAANAASVASQEQLQRQADIANRQREQAQNDAATAQAAKAQAESEAVRAERARLKAESDAAAAQNAQTQAEAQAANAQADRSAAQTEAEQARLAAQRAQATAEQAENEKAALRAKIAEQLNAILQTRDTTRGLIVSMSDVLFDTGKYTLKPGAREKLAKVAGILLAYPGLNIQVGGYTDNVGGDDMNQSLSEHRASAVRDYLVQQGVPMNSVAAYGYGNSSPVATNSTAEGRQQNRRVELLVSGEAIGVPFTASTRH